MTDRTWRMSAVKRFKRCPRSFWLSYGNGTGDGLEKAPDPDKPASGQRDEGTLTHKLLEHGYISGPKVIPEVLALTQYEQFGDHPMSKEWAKVFKLAERMATGFFEWTEETGADATEETIALETRYSAFAGTYHGDNVTITGKVDRLYRDIVTGQIGMDDWKTADSLNAPPHLDFDDQKLTYDWLLQMNGIDASTFRHTQLKKVLRTPAANPPFYARHTSTVSLDQRAAHRRHLGATISRMVQAVQAVEQDRDAHHDFLEPTPTRDCGWDCDFLAVCPLMDQGDYWETALEEWFRPRSEDA